MTTKYDGSNSLTFLLTLLKGHYAAKTDIPTKTSDITNDSGFVTTDTTYQISMANRVVTLTGSDGSTTSFTLPEGMTVDAALSDLSENPVQNKVVKAAIDAKATQQDIDDAIAEALEDISGVSFQIVQALPVTGEDGVFYLVPNSGSSPNVYDEYVWAGADGAKAFEKIGTTDVDLSGYVQTSDLVELTNNEVQAIWDSVMTE